MEKQLQQFAKLINKIPSWFWIWFILCANFVSFIPHSNEEHYFAAAKQFYNPNWLPYSFAFNEWAGTRFLFQYIVGFCLEYLSFEQMTFWGRLLNFLLFSFPLAKIFKQFKLDNIYILLILQVLLIPFQTFFGGEWIFKAFEVKTLAYIFIFYALHHLLKKQNITAIVFTIIASYFHILVGGWFAVASIIYFIINKDKLKNTFTLIGIYTLGIAPLVLYLGSHIVGVSSEINGVNLNWIYTYYRAPHHCAPFASYSLFKYNFLFGILLCTSSILVISNIKKGGFSAEIRIGFHLLLSCILILLVGIIISAIDKNGILLKFYPFRIGSIAVLLLFITLTSLLKSFILTKKLELLSIVILLFAIPFGIRGSIETIDTLRNNSSDYYNTLLANWSNQNTHKDDVFMFVDTADDKCLTFERKSERSRYVIEKAIPAGGEKLYEWYRRVEFKKNNSNNLEAIKSEVKNIRIDYLVFNKAPLDKKWLKKAYSSKAYTVYQVELK